MGSKLSYGWYIVSVATFLSVVNTTFFGYGWTAFINPILTTFGWTIAQVSIGSSLRSVEQGVFSPIFGLVVDRFSPRKLMIIGVIIAASGMFLLCFTANLAMYYAGFLLMGLGTSLTHIIPSVVISKWFKRDFGKANGILAMAAGIGGVMTPLVVKMIDTFSWQTTLLISAIVWIASGIPLSLVYRNPPPDKSFTETTNIILRQSPGDSSIGVKDAIKMRAFWHINFVAFVQIFVSTVPMIFLMPYFTSLGISRSNSSLAVLLYTLISLSGRIPFGLMADKYKSSYLIAISTGLMGLGIFIFSLIDAQSPFILILIFAIVYGLGLSGMSVLRSPVLREYFGTRNFGSILGLSNISITLGSVLPPIIVGIIVTKYGNYGPTWLWLAGLSALGVIVMLTISRSTINSKKVTTTTKI